MRYAHGMTQDPAIFASIGAATNPVFSRDGKTLFHLRGSGLPQAWALNLVTQDDRPLTFHDEKVAMLRRSPIDDRLIYGIDQGGDERQQLLLIDPCQALLEPRTLTANTAVIHDFGGWSPDGKRIAYAANERNEAHFDVYVHELESGVRSRVFDGENIVSVSGFRSDGGQLALLHDRGFGDISLLLLNIASGTALSMAAPANWQSVRWASDGRTLLALTDIGNEFMRLCRIDPDNSEIGVVYENPGRDIEAWATSPDARNLATVENDLGYAVLRVGPVDGERPIVTGLPRGVVGDLTWSPDSATLAFSAAAPTEPASLWLWRDGAVQVAWRPETQIDPAAFVDLELVQWPSFDGTRIPGWLALPRTLKPPGGYPAVVWVHGGPVSQTRPNFRPDIQMLLAHGFAVLMPNVRGSSGYGRAFTISDDVEKRLDSVADLEHGRHWLAAHPAIDGERIGIMGQSYGGFMVMSAITEYPDLWRAAVNYYGIADFVTLLEGTGAWRSNHRAAEYGDAERNADLFARISPIHRVERIQAPVLIAHGVRDPRVPIDESERFVAGLQEQQKKVAYVTFDYAGHGFIRPDDKRRIYTEVARFLAAHL